MKYKLLKDLPWAKVGDKFYEEADGHWYPVGKEINDRFALSYLYIDDHEWFEPVDERYKPDEEDTYWFVDSNGYVKNDGYRPRLSAIHEARYKCGNCFRTEEQAEESARRKKESDLNYHKELAND